MKSIREIAEMHYGTEPNNETDKKYRLNRIESLENLITEQLNIPLVSKPFVIEWADLYVNGSGTQTILNCEDIPKAINDFIEENPDCEIISVK